MGHLEKEAIDEIFAMIDGNVAQPPAANSSATEPPTNQPPTNQPPTNQPPTNQPPTNQPRTTNKPKGKKTANDGDFMDIDDFVEQDDNEADEVIVVEPKPRKPREGQSPIERSAKDLLALTPHKLDGDWVDRWVTYLKGMQTDMHSVSMTNLQNLLVYVFSATGPQALGQLAKQARQNTAAINLHQEVVRNGGLSNPNSPYADLATSLMKLNEKKVQSIYAQVQLLIQYVNTAKMFVSFDRELQNQDSEAFADYKAIVDQDPREYGRLGLANTRRQFLLSQSVLALFPQVDGVGQAEQKKAAKTHFATLHRALKTALTLYWLGATLGPGIHAMLIDSDWESMYDLSSSFFVLHSLTPLFLQGP
jgi:hypothetical protein